MDKLKDKHAIRSAISCAFNKQKRHRKCTGWLWFTKVPTFRCQPRNNLKKGLKLQKYENSVTIKMF